MAKSLKDKINTLQGKVEIMLMLGCQGLEDLDTLKEALDEHIKAIFADELEVSNV